jgi:Potassium-transporting ATPase A subunit
MTTQAWVLLGAFLLVLGLLAWPLGRWLTNEMEGRFAFGSRIESPLYRLAGVKPETQMGWLQYALALILFNALGLVLVYLLQRLQGVLPFNPQGFQRQLGASLREPDRDQQFLSIDRDLFVPRVVGPRCRGRQNPRPRPRATAQTGERRRRQLSAELRRRAHRH